MIRRRRRVLPATLVALVLLAAMVLTVVSVVQQLLGQTPVLPWSAVAAAGNSFTWDAAPVLATAAVLVVLGLILWACAWLPGQPTVLPLGSRDGRTSAGVTRLSLRRDLESAAESVDGISHATTTVTPGRVRATVRTGLADTSGLAEQVRAAIEERLSAVALERPPRIAVRVEKTRST